MNELIYKYRIYPSIEQQKKISIMDDAVMMLYNKMLRDRTEHFRETGIWKKLDPFPIVQKSRILSNLQPSTIELTCRSLEQTYHTFFKYTEKHLDKYTEEAIKRNRKDPDYKLKDNDLVGYPKYKKKRNTENFSIGADEAAIVNGKLKITGIGDIKIILHRPIPDAAAPISYTVLKKASGTYYVLIKIRLTKEVKQKRKPETAIGIAFKLGSLAVRSDDVPIQFYHCSDELAKRIEREYRTLKRKTPGSKKYMEQRKKLAKLHRKRVDQRWDSLHKTAREIVDAADIIYMETPDVLKRKWKLQRSGDYEGVLDEAWWKFSSFIQYKAEKDGKYFHKIVNAFPAYTVCSACGAEVKPNTISDIFICENCGIKLEYAINAARNYAALAEQEIHDRNNL